MSWFAESACLPDNIICLDLGSTYTKGFLLKRGKNRLRLESRCVHPTCRERPASGAAESLNRLLDRAAGAGWPAEIPGPLYCTSSAKGGLSIMAAGIVPELTLKAALLAAASAGARVAGHCEYGLQDADIKRLEREPPDIVLLTGGTDGGNERWNRLNARKLAESSYNGFIVFAGNARQQNEMRRILANKALHITANLMPEIGKLHIEPCRTLISKLFMNSIAGIKGLEEVARHCSVPLRPTPAAALDLAAALGRCPEWEQTVILDVGGATTDVYSITPSAASKPGVILKGIDEPPVKRSVEGDLGMRVSAAAVSAGVRRFPDRTIAPAEAERTGFERYAQDCADNPARMPGDDTERDFDRLLAAICVQQALLRHAGTRREVHTAAGTVMLQRGKDLRAIRRIIGSGGYLAAARDRELMARALTPTVRENGEETLLPAEAEIIFDRGYILPAAAALAGHYPQAAASFFQSGLSVQFS